MKQMTIDFPTESGTLIIEGKGSIWLYARLVVLAVECREYTTIATYDPRLSGGVIVYSENDEKLGTVIPVEL
jgi:CRISPR-associated Csx3 family protein